MNTADVFKSISDRLLSDFKSIQKSIKHNPSKGRVLEDAIIEEYLKIYLPKRVGIANGEIVCADGTSERTRSYGAEVTLDILA
jgi:hypothetical protein